MRLGELFGEAVRNTGSGVSRLLLATAALASMGGLPVLLDLSSTDHLLQEARARTEEGASTFRVIAPGQVSERACDRLSLLASVEASGALRTDSITDIRLVALPAEQLRVAQISLGFPDVVGATGAVGAGLVVGESLLARTDVQVGGNLSVGTVQSLLAVTSSFNDAILSSAVPASVLYLSNADGGFDQCWVRMVGGAVPGPEMYTVVLGSFSQIAISPVRGTGNEVGLIAESFKSRPTRFAPVTCSVLGLALGIAQVRSRRLEFSMFRHLGASRRDSQLLAGFESMMSTIPMFAVAVSVWASIAARSFPDLSVRHIVLSVALSAFAAVMGYVTGAVASAGLIEQRSVINYARER